MKKWIKALFVGLLGSSKADNNRRNDLDRKRFEDAAIARKKVAYTNSLHEARRPTTVNLHVGAGTPYSETTGMHRDYDRGGFF